jgi:hypothetical protein
VKRSLAARTAPSGHDLPPDQNIRKEYDLAVTAEILEIPEVRRRVSTLSVEEYHRLGEFNGNGKRTELIRGIVIEKISESPLHRIIASRLYRRLLAQLPEGFSVWKEEPLTFLDSEPEPDISVLAEPNGISQPHIRPPPNS